MSGTPFTPPAPRAPPPPPRFTPRQRMLNAYRGVASDSMPVAPEFWSYYAPRLLGVDMIAFSSSCNSLLGPALWRRLDKPFIAAVAREAHALGRLLHIHFHGRCAETIGDFRQIGVDCVCPFERPPGGDIRGLEGLREVRHALGDSVTFDGNVHTVETLIRGTPQEVRREVREIREAFAGSSRCIIGTGDQVGRETPDENLAALVDEAKRG